MYQELINGSYWLVGNGLNFSALRGLLWAVWKYCIVLRNMHA
jgi:hypothetical protein